MIISDGMEGIFPPTSMEYKSMNTYWLDSKLKRTGSLPLNSIFKCGLIVKKSLSPPHDPEVVLSTSPPATNTSE